MAASVRNTQYGSETASNTITVTKPTGTLENEVMVAFIQHRDSTGSLTPPSGWTLLQSQATSGGSSGNTSKAYTYYKLAGASEPASYDWISVNDGRVNASITTVTGNATTSTIDISGVSLTADGSTHDAPSVTTTQANDLVLVFAGVPLSGTSWTNPGSTTEEADIQGASDLSMDVASFTAASAGATGAKTFTMVGYGSNDKAATFSVAIKSAATPKGFIMLCGDGGFL